MLSHWPFWEEKHVCRAQIVIFISNCSASVLVEEKRNLVLFVTWHQSPAVWKFNDNNYTRSRPAPSQYASFHARLQPLKFHLHSCLSTWFNLAVATLHFQVLIKSSAAKVNYLVRCKPEVFWRFNTRRQQKQIYDFHTRKRKQLKSAEIRPLAITTQVPSNVYLFWGFIGSTPNMLAGKVE